MLSGTVMVKLAPYGRLPLGISALSCLLATLALGLNVHRNRKVLLPLHKTLAITTACLALLHLSLVLFS